MWFREEEKQDVEADMQAERTSRGEMFQGIVRSKEIQDGPVPEELRREGMQEVQPRIPSVVAAQPAGRAPSIKI